LNDVCTSMKECCDHIVIMLNFNMIGL
jgi:hypothetical protein